MCGFSPTAARGIQMPARILPIKQQLAAAGDCRMGNAAASIELAMGRR
jgi:hypothetical protein